MKVDYDFKKNTDEHNPTKIVSPVYNTNNMYLSTKNNTPGDYVLKCTIYKLA